MSTSLTTFLSSNSSKLALPRDLSKALTEGADAASSGGGGIDYLTYSGRTGLYSLGRDHAEVDPDQPYMVGPETFIGGWNCWKNSQVIERVEWLTLRAHEDAVEQDDLPDNGPYRDKTGDGWRQVLGFQAITMAKDRREIKFTTNSPSGRNVVADLMREVGRRAASEEPHIPLICFGGGPFDAQGQSNYKPDLRVDVWITNKMAVAYMAGDVTEDQLLGGGSPAASRTKKKAPTAKPTAKRRR